jgi:hypothetical protein
LIGFAKGEHGKLITVHNLIVEVAEGMRVLVEEGSTRLVRYPSEIDGNVPEHIAILSGGRSIDWPRSVASLVLGPGVDLVDAASGMDKLSRCRMLSIERGWFSRGCGLGERTGDFYRMARLRCLRLHISSYRLEQLPADIESMQSLRILDISACEAIRSLPNWIGQLTGLTTLDLSGCYALQGLPEGIGRLTGLRTLDLTDCRALRSLPEVIGGATGLTTLDLRGCGALQSLPERIGQLTGLTTLHLDTCRSLQRLPEGIGQLMGLTTLHLDTCRALESLPVGSGS